MATVVGAPIKQGVLQETCNMVRNGNQQRRWVPLALSALAGQARKPALHIFAMLEKLWRVECVPGGVPTLLRRLAAVGRWPQMLLFAMI